MEKQLNNLLEQAEEHFDKARNELFRPEEDVVPYSVCQHAYYSVTNNLSSFLMQKGSQVQGDENVHDLLKTCRALDERFKELHLGPLYQPTQSEDVWMNLDTAKDFLLMAERTREMVQKASQH